MARQQGMAMQRSRRPHRDGRRHRGRLRRLGALAVPLICGACFIDGRPADDSLHLTCTDGSCACLEPWADCDGDPSNGCEVDTSLATDHCGECFWSCIHATCEKGSCACVPAYDDCDNDPATGCEIDLRSHPQHCGDCTRSCDGGDCRESVCQPVTLLDGINSYDLAVTPTHLVFKGGVVLAGMSQPAGLWVLPLDGAGGPHLEVPETTANIQALASQGGRIFWLVGDDQGGAVMSKAVDEPTTKTVTTTAPLDTGGARLAASPEYVFWTTGTSAGPLYQADRYAQTGATVVAESVWPHLLALSDTHVYWHDWSSGLYRRPLAGGAEELIHEPVDGSISDLAADDRAVYWSFDESSEGGPRRGIRALVHGDGEPVTLLSTEQGLAQPDTLTPARGGVLFSCDLGCLSHDTDGGVIGHINLESQDVTLLAKGQLSVSTIAFTDSHVYWLAEPLLQRLVW